jgi:uncharacterized protein (DUF488 family)
MTLFTFGYEGLELSQFIARLHAADVRAVVDVRELPLSRKRGFSKRAFAEALAKAGIAYRHVPALGCPKPIRNRYRDDNDWSHYASAFSSYLRQQTEAVAALAKSARKTKECLVCFEADYSVCHRSIVARAVAACGGPAVVHLTATAAIPDVRLRAAA